jgi:hypothetical protein
MNWNVEKKTKKSRFVAFLARFYLILKSCNGMLTIYVVVFGIMMVP